MARVDEFSIKLQSYSGNLIGFSVQDETSSRQFIAREVWSWCLVVATMMMI